MKYWIQYPKPLTFAAIATRFFKVWITILWTLCYRGKPSKHLAVQSQQQKHWKKLWNIFKVNIKDIRTTSMTSFWCLYCYFEHISHLYLVSLLLLWTGKCLLRTGYNFYCVFILQSLIYIFVICAPFHFSFSYAFIHAFHLQTFKL